MSDGPYSPAYGWADWMECVRRGAVMSVLSDLEEDPDDQEGVVVDVGDGLEVLAAKYRRKKLYVREGLTWREVSSS